MGHFRDEKEEVGNGIAQRRSSGRLIGSCD